MKIIKGIIVLLVIISIFCICNLSPDTCIKFNTITKENIKFKKKDKSIYSSQIEYQDHLHCDNYSIRTSSRKKANTKKVSYQLLKVKTQTNSTYKGAYTTNMGSKESSNIYQGKRNKTQCVNNQNYPNIRQSTQNDVIANNTFNHVNMQYTPPTGGDLETPKPIPTSPIAPLEDEFIVLLILSMAFLYYKWRN